MTSNKNIKYSLTILNGINKKLIEYTNLLRKIFIKSIITSSLIQNLLKDSVLNKNKLISSGFNSEQSMMLILRQKRNNIQKSNNLQEHSTQHMNFFLHTKSSNTIKTITSGMKWSEGEICKLPLKRTSGNLIFMS